jgi:hypothetical protein|tara:strand:- start:524 stop:1384 length:861 start_codon:yes stop_codon:yes gene_type:complete
MPDLTEVQEPVKKAFISRPNSNADKIEKEEKELEKLVNEQGDNTEVEEQEATDTSSAEEKTFKKRYGDLRRHSQKQHAEYENKIAALKTQLTVATNEQIKLPKSEEELTEWAEKYPDVSAIVETIAVKKAKEQSQDLEERIQKINELQESANRDKAEVELLQLHPDFEEIRSSEDFHEWAEEQPSWVQNSLYENDTDAFSAARAIDLYKADRNLTGKTKARDNKEAAKSVNTRASRSRPQSKDTSGMIKESDVEQMSSQEYEENSEQVMEAIRSGKFIYDITGSAR